MIGLHEGRGGGRKPRRDHPARLITLHLTVAGCQPPIWRRLVLPEAVPLAQLHDAIQFSLGWYDYQTHVFTIDDLRLGNPVKRDDFVVEDDRDVTLADIDVATRGAFAYDYFFGEGWRVEIRVEGVRATDKAVFPIRCTDGARAGPPEDCGGIEAYHDMVMCLAEPHTELGEEWRSWVGPDYDAEVCDLKAINKALGAIKPEGTVSEPHEE